MSETEAYRRRWRAYRWWRNSFLLLIATYLPAALVASRLSDRAQNTVVVVWLVGTLATTIGLGTWRCPRCHKPFFHRFPANNPLAGECLNCGLPKWSLGG
jgi:hypothetical protein